MHTLPAPSVRPMQPHGQPVRRRVAGGVLLAAVLAVHLALLLNAQRQPWGAADPPQAAALTPPPQRPAAVLLVPARPAPMAAGPALAQALAAPPALGPAAARDPQALPFANARSAAAPSAAMPPAPTDPVTQVDAAALAQNMAQDTAQDPAQDTQRDTPQDRPVPIYATRPPPPATLSYTLQRGQRSVPAQLLWAHDGTGYTLALATDDSAAPGAGPLRGLGATSRGSFDAAGLAPERFVDRRRARDRRAASFDRDSGRVLQSASAAPAALQPGMQDRVSWMLQLAAILEANPALAATGARVQLWVAATRGPPQVWDFEVLPPGTSSGAEPGADPGPGSVNSPDSTTSTPPPGLLHLQRRAARPHDLQVDAWLDPARHHLPWRVVLSAPPGDWRSDLRLTGP